MLDVMVQDGTRTDCGASAVVPQPRASRGCAVGRVEVPKKNKEKRS